VTSPCMVQRALIVHRFFVSYTNASSANSTEPQSSDFTTTINYQFVATNSVGIYTYGCCYHFSMMNGCFQVVPAGTIPEFQPLAFLALLIVVSTSAALVRRRRRQVWPSACVASWLVGTGYEQEIRWYWYFL
jgi:hypothetical protein